MSEKEYQKQYYENHKDKHKEYYKRKITCPVCQSVYCRSAGSNHIKTLKHQKALALIEKEDKYDTLLKKYKKIKEKMNKIL